MNPRERYLATLLFAAPDRLPFIPGWGRESTLRRWHSEGLAPGRSPLEALCEEIGIAIETTKPAIQPDVSFRMMPEFEEKVLEHRPGSPGHPGHLILQDWMGNVVEISDEFDATYIRSARDFVTRRWHKFPVANRADFEAIKYRYDANDPSRYPRDCQTRAQAMRERDYVTSIQVSGPFWQMREWCGFEPLCMMFAEQPDFVREMTQFWCDFVSRVADRAFDAGVVDRFGISEDMAYKEHPMISPDAAREILLPCWRRWTAEARQAGVPIVDMDSDGRVDLLIPLWIDSGIHVCDPVEVAAGCDIVEYRRRFGKRIAYTGSVDKRCIAKGGAAIEAELARLAPVARDGGFVPSCDHAIPSDVSWANFVHYGRCLAQITGWR